MKLFTAEKPLNVQREFTADLKAIGMKIKKRLFDSSLQETKLIFSNETWSVPNEYLLPETIPCRIDK